jgi:TRAP-type C4-dicarboxylate transport system permease small subunit
MSHSISEIQDQPPVSNEAGGFLHVAIARLNTVIVVLSSIALLIASFVLTYSVFSRYFFHFSTDWQDELSVFLIVGAVFMSSASIQASRGHVAIEAIVGLLPARTNRIRLVLVDAISFVFCGYFSWKSWTLLEEAWTENFHSGSTWGPPLWVPYSLMAIGMSLLSIQILLQIVAETRRKAIP